MKFNIGDIVEVIDYGYGFPDSSKGNKYTISEYDSEGYNKREGYKLKEDTGNINPSYSGWVGVNSFKLVLRAEADVPKDNPNVKMIETFVPSWAKWMAMQADGQWFIFTEKPVALSSTWCKKDGTAPRDFTCKIGQCDPEELEVDWKETLHKI